MDVRILLVILFVSASLFGQNEKHTISGYLKDQSSGEDLIGATIYVQETQQGAATNEYGYYALTLPAGIYTVKCAYLGFENLNQTITLNSDKELNFELIPESTTMEEIVITAKVEDENVEDVQMSKIDMNIDRIKKMPALLGEVDIIKAIQLLPGVQSVGEGTSGFYVRGGSADQNLILLDEAPVYNASHLLGFFSVFNPDAIKDLQLYKGGIPAQYGGRLASVLDIRMKEGNSKKFSGSGGIGTISSRLTLEAPMLDGKSSFMISGRRTYADIFLGLSKDTTLQKSTLYFYDLNLKWNYDINENNRVFVSGYLGRDVFGTSEFGNDWGNTTTTARWNHIFSKKLFSNFTLHYADYDYKLSFESEVDGFEWKSKIRDLSGKADFQYFINPENSLKFGAGSILHKINPGHVKGIGNSNIFNELHLQEQKSFEHAVYVSNEQKFSSRLSATYGVRYSVFQNIGPYTQYNFDDSYELKDSTIYSGNEVFQTYGGLEPRLGVKYTLDSTSSIKASYNRTRQYLQLASNSTASSPLDVWFPASPNVKPQLSDQVALGYFRNFNNNVVELSAEVYYKKMQNSIDFEDHAYLLLNKYIEGELRFGASRSYGLELFVRKNKGRLTGWVAYTLSRSERKIDELNFGEYYPVKFDKIHDLAVVASYDLTDRVTLSGNWIYGTGSAITAPTGQLNYQGTVVPVYSEKNGARMPAYHRLDLSASIKARKKLFNKCDSEWLISIYNVYQRHNAYSINFREDEDTGETFAEKTYLFGIIPSVTWNFKF